MLRRLLRYLENHGSPRLAHLVRAKHPQPRTVTATTDELAKMLTAAPPHLQLAIRLWSELALRFREARTITPTDHDLEHHTIRVRVKGGKTRTLPTTPPIDALLAAARLTSQTEPAIDTLAGRILSDRSLRDHFAKLLKDTGCKPINPHDLRRTTATHIYATTKDLRAAQQMLGHENMSSTLRYIAPLSEETLRPLLEQLWTPKGPIQ